MTEPVNDPGGRSTPPEAAAPSRAGSAAKPGLWPLLLAAGAGAFFGWLARRRNRPTALEPALHQPAPGGMTYVTRASSQGNLPVNIYQTGHDLVVLAPVPGLAPEDISLELRPNTLTIRGRLRGPGQEDRNYLFREWSYGPCTRIVELPFPVDSSRINVFLRHGVLTVVMPRSETPTRPRWLSLGDFREEKHEGRVRLVGHGHEAALGAPHGREHEREPEPLTPGAS